MPPADRGAWLERACNGDIGLLSEVREMLQADQCRGVVHEHVRAAVAQLAQETPTAPGRAGPYRLTKELGRGGMGSVYLGVRDDGQYEAEVAVKLIRPGMDNKFFLERFKRERQALARLEHPNIARIYDSGTTAEGLPYIVMELVRGEPVTAYVKRKHFTVDETLRLFLEVCAAVSHAHQRQIVHRDLKPGNILVQDNGTPKLLDFGICKLMEAGPLSEPEMTAKHIMTPSYASPEQIAGLPSTVASDVYSLAAVLAEILPPGIRDSRIEEILKRAMTEDSARRYQTVDQLANEVRLVLSRPSKRARRPWIFAAAAALAGAAIFGGLRFWEKPASRVDAKAMPLFLEAHRTLKVHVANETREQAQSRAQTAVQMFQQAARQYPDSADVQAGLAEAYLGLADYDEARYYDYLKLARQTAERGLALDGNLDALHHSLGETLLFGSWEPAKALVSFERAVRLNPRNSAAHRLRADVLCMFGRFEEALAALDAVLVASPLDTEAGAEKASVYFRWRRFHQAEQAAQQTLGVQKDDDTARWVLALAYQFQGRREEAEALYRTLPPRPRRYPISLAHLLITSGRSREAAPLIENLEKARKNPSAIALLYAVKGDYQRALSLLDQALAEKDVNLLYVPMDPRYDAIREHPRFVKLFQQLGLPTL